MDRPEKQRNLATHPRAFACLGLPASTPTPSPTEAARVLLKTGFNEVRGLSGSLTAESKAIREKIIVSTKAVHAAIKRKRDQ